MRKRYRVLLLAAFAAFVVPVGFALSLDSAPATHIVRVGVSPQVLPSWPVLSSWSMPDSAKLLFVGTVLFGLAAAVRKTS
jgi:hypothetical protein